MRAPSLILLALAAAACGAESPQAVCPPPLAAAAPAPSAAASAAAAAAAPTVAEAVQFVADVEKGLRKVWVDGQRADWVNENFITDDTQILSARAAAETARFVGDAIERSRRFDSIRSQLPPDVARKLYLLSVSQTIPAPEDPAAREELAGIETWMTSAYGKGKYCPPAGSPLLAYVSAKGGAKGKKGAAAEAAAPGPASCLTLDDLSKVLAKSRKIDELLEAWRGWHAIAEPMRAKYARYVDLADQGAREIGFADVGALWRSGYDMSPEDFEADVERLWSDVKPLYDELHCYVRARLQEKYGKDHVPDHAPIPAELLGNMWAQQWSDIYDLLVPYPKEPSLDVDKGFAAKHWGALDLVHQGERFYLGLGFDPLPETFWRRSLFTRPRDRDVVCHASAWDVTYAGDLRIKACLQPTEDDFVTVHHELGHDFYFQRYDPLPILFQAGANDGFHEAIGDTMALSVTPAYLQSLGLLAALPAGDHGRINQQMKMALDKVAFLPFGLLIDKWRWDVFSGKTKPADYESAWWALKEKYQGVSRPVPSEAGDFDPGAKFHVANSTPYVRYFLARIYQFQFHKALCAAAGYSGPLDQCSIHDHKEAGARLMKMLVMGASKPWPDAMEAIGAGRRADAGPMLEYFAPLRAWLAAQNKGRTCGW